jgi:hypothetical protein
VEKYYGNGLAMNEPDYRSIYYLCNGKESSLNNCRAETYLNGNSYTCSHQNDVIIFCENWNNLENIYQILELNGQKYFFLKLFFHL